MRLPYGTAELPPAALIICTYLIIAVSCRKLLRERYYRIAASGELLA
jgi:hypothetical protein